MKRNNYNNGGRRNNEDMPPKKPTFGLNWLYMLVIAALVGMFFFGGENTTDSSVSKPATYTEFQLYLQKGYVKSITINNVERELQLYLKPERIREVFKQSAKQTGKSPYLLVAYGSAEKVESYIDDQRAKGNFKGALTYDNKQKGGWWDMLLNFGPVILIVLFWILIFRNMGGGMGSGVFGVG